MDRQKPVNNQTDVEEIVVLDPDLLLLVFTTSKHKVHRVVDKDELVRSVVQQCECASFLDKFLNSRQRQGKHEVLHCAHLSLSPHEPCVAFSTVLLDVNSITIDETLVRVGFRLVSLAFEHIRAIYEFPAVNEAVGFAFLDLGPAGRDLLVLERITCGTCSSTRYKNELTLVYTPALKKYAESLKFELGVAQTYYQSGQQRNSIEFSTGLKL